MAKTLRPFKQTDQNLPPFVGSALGMGEKDNGPLVNKGNVTPRETVVVKKVRNFPKGQ